MKPNPFRSSRILPNLILLLFPWCSIVLLSFAPDFLYQLRKYRLYLPGFLVVYALFLLVFLSFIYQFLCKAVPVSRICVILGMAEFLPFHFTTFWSSLSFPLYQAVVGCYPYAYALFDLQMVLYGAILLMQFHPRRH